MRVEAELPKSMKALVKKEHSPLIEEEVGAEALIPCGVRELGPPGARQHHDGIDYSCRHIPVLEYCFIDI